MSSDLTYFCNSIDECENNRDTMYDRPPPPPPRPKVSIKDIYCKLLSIESLEFSDIHQSVIKQLIGPSVKTSVSSTKLTVLYEEIKSLLPYFIIDDIITGASNRSIYFIRDSNNILNIQDPPLNTADLKSYNKNYLKLLRIIAFIVEERYKLYSHIFVTKIRHYPFQRTDSRKNQFINYAVTGPYPPGYDATTTPHLFWMWEIRPQRPFILNALLPRETMGVVIENNRVIPDKIKTIHETNWKNKMEIPLGDYTIKSRHFRPNGSLRLKNIISRGTSHGITSQSEIDRINEDWSNDWNNRTNIYYSDFANDNWDKLKSDGLINKTNLKTFFTKVGLIPSDAIIEDMPVDMDKILYGDITTGGETISKFRDVEDFINEKMDTPETPDNNPYGTEPPAIVETEDELKLEFKDQIGLLDEKKLIELPKNYEITEKYIDAKTNTSQTTVTEALTEQRNYLTIKSNQKKIITSSLNFFDVNKEYKDNWLIHKITKIIDNKYENNNKFKIYEKDFNLLCDIYDALKNKYVHIDDSSSLNKLYQNINILPISEYIVRDNNNNLIIDYIKKLDKKIRTHLSKINNKNDFKNVFKKCVDIDWESYEYLKCI